MPRPCFCDQTASCRLCYLYYHHKDYRELWDRAGPNSELLRLRDAPCEYLGDDTGQRQRCATCRGHVSLKVYVCRHPGHADQPTTTRPGCLRCADYAPTRGDS